MNETITLDDLADIYAEDTADSGNLAVRTASFHYSTKNPNVELGEVSCLSAFAEVVFDIMTASKEVGISFDDVMLMAQLKMRNAGLVPSASTIQ